MDQLYIQSVYLYEIIVLSENQHLSHTLHNDFNLNYDIIGHAYSIASTTINKNLIAFSVSLRVHVYDSHD